MNTLRSLVDFYVTQHNAVMPHAALNGAPLSAACGITALCCVT